jgi:hypothetical protein
MSESQPTLDPRTQQAARRVVEQADFSQFGVEWTPPVKVARENMAPIVALREVLQARFPEALRLKGKGDFVRVQFSTDRDAVAAIRKAVGIVEAIVTSSEIEHAEVKSARPAVIVEAATKTEAQAAVNSLPLIIRLQLFETLQRAHKRAPETVRPVSLHVDRVDGLQLEELFSSLSDILRSFGGILSIQLEHDKGFAARMFRVNFDQTSTQVLLQVYSGQELERLIEILSRRMQREGTVPVTVEASPRRSEASASDRDAEHGSPRPAIPTHSAGRAQDQWSAPSPLTRTIDRGNSLGGKAVIEHERVRYEVTQNFIKLARMIFRDKFIERYRTTTENAYRLHLLGGSIDLSIYVFRHFMDSTLPVDPRQARDILYILENSGEQMAALLGIQRLGTAGLSFSSGAKEYHVFDLLSFARTFELFGFEGEEWLEIYNVFQSEFVYLVNLEVGRHYEQHGIMPSEVHIDVLHNVLELFVHMLPTPLARRIDELSDINRRLLIGILLRNVAEQPNLYTVQSNGTAVIENPFNELVQLYRNGKLDESNVYHAIVRELEDAISREP